MTLDKARELIRDPGPEQASGLAPASDFSGVGMPS